MRNGYSRALSYKPLLYIKERLSNNLPFDINHVLMYRRTHLAQSEEVHLVDLMEFRPRNV